MILTKITTLEFSVLTSVEASLELSLSFNKYLIPGINLIFKKTNKKRKKIDLIRILEA